MTPADIIDFQHIDLDTLRSMSIVVRGDAGQACLRGPEPPTKRKRKRRPTLAKVKREAARAGIEVARYEVRADGINVVPGKPSTADSGNEWDEVLPKDRLQ